jgi:hypothetical protein
MKKLFFIPFFLLVILLSCKSKKTEPAVISPDNTSAKIHDHLIHTLASAGCEANSWSPEIYTLYGDAATINKKLENADMDLSSRRLYLVAIESGDRATIKLYEKSKTEGNVIVEQWSGNDASDFISQVSKNILANKGINCVGEQTQALLEKLQPKNLGDVPSPVSAQAAFSHDIKNLSDKYLRVTVFLMC